MFGEPEYLSMFSELYVATMRHMQVRAGAWRLQELQAAAPLAGQC